MSENASITPDCTSQNTGHASHLCCKWCGFVPPYLEHPSDSGPFCNGTAANVAEMRRHIETCATGKMRDAFAGQALTGMLAHECGPYSVAKDGEEIDQSMCDHYARTAYALADAMLKARLG